MGVSHRVVSCADLDVHATVVSSRAISISVFPTSHGLYARTSHINMLFRVASFIASFMQPRLSAYESLLGVCVCPCLKVYGVW